MILIMIWLVELSIHVHLENSHAYGATRKCAGEFFLSLIINIDWIIDFVILLVCYDKLFSSTRSQMKAFLVGPRDEIFGSCSCLCIPRCQHKLVFVVFVRLFYRCVFTSWYQITRQQIDVSSLSIVRQLNVKCDASSDSRALLDVRSSRIELN